MSIDSFHSSVIYDSGFGCACEKNMHLMANADLHIRIDIGASFSLASLLKRFRVGFVYFSIE